MEAKAVKVTPPPFQPVKLEITFDYLDELEAFYAIMDHPLVVDAVGLDSESDLIRDALREARGSDIDYLPYLEALNVALDEYCYEVTGVHNPFAVKNSDD